MSAEAEAPTKFDPNNDPAKLAKIGAFVTKRLDSNPLVQKIDVPELQAYVYQGFLGKRDCDILIKKIDAEAVPSTLYKGTEQAGFRTSYSCHLNRWDADIARIEARMSDTLGIDNNFAERCKASVTRSVRNSSRTMISSTQARAIGNRKDPAAVNAAGPR